MTVPHLMNCPHLDDAWCLDCVAEMGNERWKLQGLLCAIGRRAYPNPSRTFDDAIRDLDAITDLVRLAVPPNTTYADRASSESNDVPPNS